VVTGGGSLGLVLGGVITEWLSWRWVLFINVPIGIAVLVLAPLFVAETPRLPGRFDLARRGHLYSWRRGLGLRLHPRAGNGWGDPTGLAAFGLAAVLLVTFGLTEFRVAQAELPRCGCSPT